MKKIIILYFTIIFSGISAQTKVESGYSNLKIGNSARNQALADFGMTGNPDVANVSYNPAVLSILNGSQLFFSHNSWIQDVSSQSIAGNSILYGIPFSIQVNNTMIKDIEIRTKPGELQSKFDARYFSTSFSLSSKLYDNLSGGITLKYLYENILSDESSGYAFDFGFLYTGIIPKLDLSFSLRNIGSVSELRNISSKLPRDIRLGGNYQIDFEKITSTLNFVLGVQKYLAENDNHIHLGAEYIYDEIVFLRVGYVSAYESHKISYGLGFSWASARLDYAYLPFDYNLGSSNTISLLYNF